MNDSNRRHTNRRFKLLGILACAAMLGTGFFTETRAETIYSYIDDQGNPVYTDAPETIPEKYRAKVRTHERPGADAKSPSVMQSAQEAVKEQAKNLGKKASSLHFDIGGLSPAQSKIFNYAGAAAVVLLLIMYLSRKSPMIRLLALGLLIVLGLGAPVLMYVSDGGSMDVMKEKAAAAGQAQQDRLQQVPR